MSPLNIASKVTATPPHVSLIAHETGHRLSKAAGTHSTRLWAPPKTPAGITREAIHRPAKNRLAVTSLPGPRGRRSCRRGWTPCQRHLRNRVQPKLYSTPVIRHQTLNRASGLESGVDLFDSHTGRLALERLLRRMSLEMGIRDRLVTRNEYMSWRHGADWVSGQHTPTTTG
jgi:hypothetical protein